MEKKHLYKEEYNSGSESEEEEEEEEEESEEIEEEEDDSIVNFDGLEMNTSLRLGNSTIKNDSTKPSENIEHNDNHIEINNLQEHTNDTDEQNLNNLIDEAIQFSNIETKERQTEQTDVKLEETIKDKLDLLDLDLESMPKDDLINLLLKTEEEPKPTKKKHRFNPRPKTQPNHLDNVYNMQINDKQDPELANDFNTALTKILAKMVKSPNDINTDIYDILISDKDKIEEELSKVFNIFI